jgi:hypothetical protein
MATVVLLALIGLQKGLLRPISGIGGLIIGVFLAVQHSLELAVSLEQYIEGDTVRRIAAFVAIVIGSVVVSRIAALLIKKLLTTLVLGWLDHVAGAVAGAAVGSRGGGNVNLPADRRSAERRSYPLRSPGAGKSRKEPRMGPIAQISWACSTSTWADISRTPSGTFWETIAGQ